MNMDTVRRVAQDWDIRIDDLKIRIDKSIDGLAGVTYPIGRSCCGERPSAARNCWPAPSPMSGSTWRTCSGRRLPESNEEAVPWEDRAYAFEDDWWDNHPRNQ